MQRDKFKNNVCPDCQQPYEKGAARRHIERCPQYIPTYVNNVTRFISQMTPTYLEFLAAEMDIIKEMLQSELKTSRGKQAGQVKTEIPKRDINKNNISNQQKIINQAKNSQNNLKEQSKNKLQPKSNPKPKQQIDGTLQLQDIQYIFKDDYRAKDEKLNCINPKCKDPVGANDIEHFTYLDACLHPICLFCLRDYVRNNYVSQNGQLKCPSQECDQIIPNMQIKPIVDPAVLTKLQNELNSKGLDLIECQKCHENYQFEKGKAADAPKKTAQGKVVSSNMAKHYAENRFQCPKCKTEQCKSCKGIPYHIGYNCEEFAEHKLKKKCRYCHSVLPKGYQSQSGIKTFNDICDSQQCTLQAKEACSKMLKCGHPCFGYIRQKNCLPCLNEKCAVKDTQLLRGQNENSYCSLCYVQTLGEAPCIRSNCGHIFHLKCLRKRLELKWETARITFRFCQCPVCNKWLELPEQSSLSKSIQKYLVYYNKIKEKAMKRLVHEKEDKDSKLTDSTSVYFKNPEKYALTIYAYFECFQCNEPYFGGRKSCADAMGQAKGDKFNPKELICPACCPVQVTDCKKHGKEYISFKCRFCCQIAQWFCWGNTHFCDECHKRQIAGEYISRIPKQKLAKCQGKGKCPVGGEHGLNGDEFCLGCGLCRGERLDQKDF